MTSSIRSLSTLLYNGLFFSVFMYLFAVIGITLFRVLTGEDWTDLRYNLVLASEMGVIDAPSGVITAFHVAWFVVATFLLLNLLVGAILNNYQVVMAELKEKREGG